jgi:hypothetical protein
MLNISNVLLSYADRGLSQVSSQATAHTNSVINEPVIIEQQNVRISDEARRALNIEKQAEQQHLDNRLEQSIELSDQQKQQARENLDLYIDAAQRYAQQSTVQPVIENRHAISAYSLIADRVLATSASNSLES